MSAEQTTGRACRCGRPAQRKQTRCAACKMRDLRASWAERGAPAHGLSGYRTYGCRCETCREAKREYMRARRAAGAELAKTRADQGAVKAGDHIKHGSQFGYYEHGCRCPECIRWGRTWRAGRPRARAAS